MKPTGLEQPAKLGLRFDFARPISITFAAVLLLLPFRVGGGGILGSTQTSNVYSYFYSVMDKFHRITDELSLTNYACFDVYTFKDAGGNHFIPSGFMGDSGDVVLDPGSTNAPYKGIECFKVAYSAEASQGFGWAGVYWQYPQTNWGSLPGFYDLSGATELRFFAKGAVGGEQVEFKMGGINRPPSHDSGVRYQDSCDLLTTGLITLTNRWAEYSIDLVSPEFFWVYRNNLAPENHFYPSGWMGDWSDLTVDENCTSNPYSAPSCIKISYSAQASQGAGWAGIYWQFPANNWGSLPGGYDLSGATKLTFWARADLPLGTTHTGPIEFLCGGINRPLSGIPGFTNQDSFVSPSLWTKLTSTWQQFTINLTGLDLANVIGGFCWVTSASNNPAGCVIYLDDIRFDKLVSKDLSHTIGGFCVAADQAHNPSGCTFYLGDVRYFYSPTNSQQRMDQRGFLSSYEVFHAATDDPLRNAAFVYDNALAMLAFMARGTVEDWERTKLLADAFCSAQQNDRYFNNIDPRHHRYDGRLRNAYRAGDLIDPATGKASLPGWFSEDGQAWYEDSGFDSTSTGNMAWTIIALLGYYKHDPAQKYWNAANDLGHWIIKNRSTNGYGGFTGGYEGWDQAQTPSSWKSTEHNLDTFIAFSMLGMIDTNTAEKLTWQQNALYAKDFVISMWEPVGGFFWTGTELTNGQEIINGAVIPLDVQAWSLMALDDWQNYTAAISWAEANCGTVSDGFDGFDFSLDPLASTNNKAGVWFEGTAQMVVTYELLGRLDTARHFISQIEKAVRVPIDDFGKGVPAASRDGTATGFEWQYFNRLHVGASSWYLFATEGFNPYRQLNTPARVQNDLSLTIARPSGNGIRLIWNGTSGYSFVVESCDLLSAQGNSWAERASLPGQAGLMSWEDLGVIGQNQSGDRFYRIRVGY
jgi:hypothetical protein